MMKKRMTRYTDFSLWRRWVADHIVYIVAIVAVVPLMLWRDFTPANELRYLSIADEALARHAFFAFTNHGVAYADKPPLYLWIVMAGKWLLGHHSMAWLMLFSLLPALMVTTVMDGWVGESMPKPYRRAAQAMLLTTSLFAGAMVFVRMDMLMTLFIVLALRALHDMETGVTSRVQGTRRMALFVFAAVFTKGPMGILLPLVASAAYLYSLGRMRMMFVYWGWGFWLRLLPVFSLWFAAVYVEGGADYLHNLLLHQTVGRAVHSFHHAAPWYYYLLAITYSLLPWTPLFLVAIGRMMVRRHAVPPVERTLLAMLIAMLTVLSVVSAKLAIYMLPTIPFAVYVTALYLSRQGQDVAVRVAIGIIAIVFVSALAVWGFVSASGLYPFVVHPVCAVASGMLCIAGLSVLVVPYLRKHSARAVMTLCGGMALAVFVLGWTMPSANPYIGYAALCSEAVAQSHVRRIGTISAWRMSRAENADVYVGRPVHVLPPTDVPDSLPPTLLMTRKSEVACFRDQPHTIIGNHALVVWDPKH